MATQVESRTPTRRRARSRHSSESTSPAQRLVAGAGAGLAGGIALAVPIVVWDWVRTGHRALELPMAATAWVFGLDHFSRAQNHWWSIVLGAALLASFSALVGVAFATLVEVPPRPQTLLAGGLAWSFVTFVFFWYVLLPIARDGAPFRASARDPQLYTAPNWVWILGFTLLGVVTALCTRAFRPLPGSVEAEERDEARDDSARRFRHAA